MYIHHTTVIVNYLIKKIFLTSCAYCYKIHPMKFCAYCRKERLADVVLEMVKDETNNGKCMVVTPQSYFYKEDFPKVEDVFLSTEQS